MSGATSMEDAVAAALKLDWAKISKELNLPADKPFTIQVIQPKDPHQPLTLLTKPAPAPAPAQPSQPLKAQPRPTAAGATDPAPPPAPRLVSRPSGTLSSLASPPPPAPSAPSTSRPSVIVSEAGPSRVSSLIKCPPVLHGGVNEEAGPSERTDEGSQPEVKRRPWHLAPMHDGTCARSRPYVKGHKGAVQARSSPPKLNADLLRRKRLAIQTSLQRQQRSQLLLNSRAPVIRPLEGCARTRPFTNDQSDSTKAILALETPVDCEPKHLLSFAAKSPALLGVPLSSVAAQWEPASKKPRKQVFPPLSPRKPLPEHLKKKGFLKSSLTCARVRPVGGKSFSAARTRPFSGLRKDRNWFYFMIHPERNGRYISRVAVRARTEDLNSRSTKAPLISTEIPLPLQYRGYIQRPPKLFLSSSLIHRVGVFADEDLICGRLVLEYRGQVHRWSLCDRREEEYKAAGLGSYMFRLDDPSRGEGQVSTCLDATRWGSIARFINHSCDPNCAAKTITFEDQRKIVLYTIRNVEQGEELSYNYNMPYEDEKIPCFCGARNCKKTLN